jgi:hypothetical protein
MKGSGEGIIKIFTDPDPGGPKNTDLRLRIRNTAFNKAPEGLRLLKELKSPSSRQKF